MVLYFTPIGTDADKDDWKIYMGRDKYENEDLIKYGLPHDVWWAACLPHFAHHSSQFIF